MDLRTRRHLISPAQTAPVNYQITEMDVGDGVVWLKSVKSFAADAAVLERHGWREGVLIAIRNPKTGGVQVFSPTGEILYTPDGDIGGWKFKSLEGSLLSVFND